MYARIRLCLCLFCESVNFLVRFEIALISHRAAVGGIKLKQSFHFSEYLLSKQSAQIALADPGQNPGTFINVWFRQTAAAPVYLHPVNGTYWHI